MLWGTTGTTQALAPAGAQPPVIGALRLVVGGMVLLIYSLSQVSLITLRQLIRSPKMLLAALLAAACMAAYQCFFFAGVARTGVAVGTIVGIGSAPIFAGLLGYAFRAEHLGRIWIAATLLAVLGCTLLALSGGQVRVDIAGMALAVAAGGVYAMFTLFSKRLLEAVQADLAMTLIFCIGALFLSPLLFTAQLSWLSQPAGWMAVLHLGLVTVGVAYTLFGRGLRLVPVATTGTLTLAEPLTAGLLGIFVLGERLTPLMAAGIALLVTGLALLTFRRQVASPSEV